MYNLCIPVFDLQLKLDIEKSLQTTFTDFKAVEYRKKPEQRTNIYLIKVIWLVFEWRT